MSLRLTDARASQSILIVSQKEMSDTAGLDKLRQYLLDHGASENTDRIVGYPLSPGIIANLAYLLFPSVTKTIKEMEPGKCQMYPMGDRSLGRFVHFGNSVDLLCYRIQSVRLNLSIIQECSEQLLFCSVW